MSVTAAGGRERRRHKKSKTVKDTYHIKHRGKNQTMKYSSVILSTLLAAITHAATAAEANCCHAAADKGCTSPYVDSPNQSGSVTINGLNTVSCCLDTVTDAALVIDTMQLCPGSEPPAETVQTTTGADLFSGDTGGDSSFLGGSSSSEGDFSSTSTTTSNTESSSGGDDDSVAGNCFTLQEQFPGCSCVTQCPGSDAQCTGASADDCSVSCAGGGGTSCGYNGAAGVVASTSLTIGAAVAFIAMIFA